MAKIMINGEVCSGSSSYASAIEYIKEDGTNTTVQDELRELAYRPVNNNILINSNFLNPVNQRGVTAETWLPTPSGTPTYGIDRWNTAVTVVSIDGGLTIKKNTGGNGHYLEQVIEGKNIQAGEKYTLSACVDGNVLSGTVIAPLSNYDGPSLTFFETDGVRGAFQYISGNYYCYFILKDDNAHTITWAKLELGEVATPYVPRLYTEELQLCKRYFERVILNAREGGYGGFLLTPDNYTTSIIILKQEIKRINPTITIPNVDKFYLQVGDTTSCEKEYEISNIDAYSKSEYIQVQFKHVSITQPFRSLTLRPGAYMDVDAEL